MNKQYKKKICLLGSVIALIFSVGQIKVEAKEETKEYVVGYSPTHSPFAYTNSKGEASGMAIGIMNKIASVGDFQITYVSIEDYEEHIDINLSVFQKDQLDYHTEHSEPYVTFPMIGIGKQKFDDDAITEIGHLDYSFIKELHFDSFGTDIQIHRYTSYADMETDLNNGTLDYLVASSLVAKDLIKTTSDESNDLIPVHDMLAIPFSLSSQVPLEEVEALNQIIKHLNRSEIQAIVMNEALHVDEVKPFSEIITYYQKEIIIIILLMVSIIVLVELALSINNKRALQKSLEIDSLTGLASERGFLKKVKEVLEQGGAEYTIISIDVDNFKYINELYGYEIGTQVIQAVAKHFEHEFAHAKIIARVYADHFLILIPTFREEGITICGKRQCRECSRHILDSILGESYNLDMSIGLYHIEDATLPLTYMIDCANNARSSGKGTYGRTHAIFTKNQEKSLKQKNDVVQTMEQGIKNQEFRMFYQPKIDLKSSKIIGAEALVRWFKEDGSQIYPDEFIPLFEKNGFIVRLDYYVFDAVCQFMKEHEEVPKVAINLSGVTLLDEKLLENLFQITRRHNIKAKRIEIEITESAIVENFDKAISKILLLNKQGFTIAMDDFGAGVSSLNRLNEIYFDVLKIDKQFLSDSLIGKRGAIIIENIIRLAKQLGVSVVAEGVETKEQVELLQGLECDMAQGYYYDRPLSEEDFLERLKL